MELGLEFWSLAPAGAPPFMGFEGTSGKIWLRWKKMPDMVNYGNSAQHAPKRAARL